MKKTVASCLLGAVGVAASGTVTAGTDVYFNPLTQSASVASPNHVNELNSPWLAPAGISQKNLTSLSKVEADIEQSIIRVPAGTSSSMIDMLAFHPDGQYLFFPHETPFGAGATRYDIENDFSEVIFSGDLGGANGDWSADYGAFDPARWTPNDTLFLGEEWTAEGRIIEVMNPMAPAEDIEVRELESIANVAHEGIMFSEEDERVIYYVDEWNSGAIYKFVTKREGDYTEGQTFVLSVDAFSGDPAANWNEGANANAERTGYASWVPLTDRKGNPLTETDPFRNGPTSDPRNDPNARGGRAAADEAGATPYGRPEDVEVGKLANGNEVLYVAITSEQAVYTVEMLGSDKAYVRLMLNADTPKNVGFPETTGFLNAPDNLALDALGNLYVIEDAPNGSDIGGDIWFARDTDNDGVAESLDHFMSIQVDGSEATGMIFNPANPTQFVLAVQHPDSTDLSNVPEGFGDAVWSFDLQDVVPPVCDEKGRHNPRWRHRLGKHEYTCTNAGDYHFVELLERAGEQKDRRGRYRKPKNKGPWWR